MNLNRSVTPPPSNINYIPVEYDKHLRNGELPCFYKTDNRVVFKHAPPAPRRGSHIVKCKCKLAYLILNGETNKTLEGHNRCGYCDNVR